jgi:hypothetical protein
VVDFQIAALDHIAQAAPDLPIPRVLRSLGGQSIERLPDGSISMVRMLTYLDGVQIKDTDRSDGQRRAMGSGLARLDLALQGFNHAGAHHDLLWNVSAAHRLRDKMESLQDPAKRQLARHFMTRFEEQVLPRLRRPCAGDSQRLSPLQRAGGPARAGAHHRHHRFRRHAARAAGGEVATAAAFHMTGNEDPLPGRHNSWRPITPCCR